MSYNGIILNKVPTNNPPAVNKAKIYYDQDSQGVGSPVKLVAMDEKARRISLGGLAVQDYRLIKVISLFVGSGTYTPTNGAQALYVECIGGGGGTIIVGSNSFTTLGAGGSSGSYSGIWIPSPLKSSYFYVVGRGGSSLTSPNYKGEDTTFDSPSVCTGAGGNPGKGSLSAPQGVNFSAIGSGTLGNIGVGDLKLDGCDGGYALCIIVSSAGIVKSGDGGGAVFTGLRAIGITPAGDTPGNNGRDYGGGGSGGATVGASSASSSGGKGLIRIQEFA